MSFTERLGFKRELYEAMREDIKRGTGRDKVMRIVERELARQQQRMQFIYDDDELPPGLQAAKENFLETIREG